MTLPTTIDAPRLYEAQEREAQRRPGGKSSSAELLDRFNDAYKSPEGRGVARVMRRGDHHEAALENGAEAALGKNEHVLDPRRMDARLAPAMDHEPPYFTPKEWRPLGFCLIRAAEEDETARDSEDEETKEWLSAFLEDPRAVGVQDYDWSLTRNVPLDGGEQLYSILAADDPAFVGEDRRLYLRVGKLLAYVNKVYGQRTTRADLIRRLSRLGFKKPRNGEGAIGCRPPEDKGQPARTRRYLASPPGFDPEGVAR